MMKYIVVIMDGASGLPLPQRGGKTTLELAPTPHLDALAREGVMGMARTVPQGMEPDSACACMSVMGYNPREYYRGRAAIEANSMGLPIGGDEAVFRCNLVSVIEGRMLSYSAGNIPSAQAAGLVASLNEAIGDDDVHIYPGVSYRNILKLKNHPETLSAVCTPPHNIPDKPVAEHLPAGDGSSFLRRLAERSEEVLRGHPINEARRARGEPAATTIWPFWGSGPIPAMPSFQEVYGLKGALTSGVDLLKGLAGMVGMDVLDIGGVTDGLDNDFAAQAEGVLEALKAYDLVVVHIEAPDEASHIGSVDDKVEAILRIDADAMARLRAFRGGDLRLLVMPDHPTPIETRTHSAEPVPFLMWGVGIKPDGASAFTEAEGQRTGFSVDPGYNIMMRLIKG